MSTPSITTCPEVGASRPGINPSSVDFPLPDGPRMARNWPRDTDSRSGCRMVSGSAPLITVFETSRSSITWCPLLNNRPEHGPDVLRHDPRALSGRVNAVALIQPRVAGDALQEKRHERDVILARERRIDLVKRDDVVAAVVGRRFHPGEHHRDAARLRPLDDL